MGKSPSVAAPAVFVALPLNIVPPMTVVSEEAELVVLDSAAGDVITLIDGTAITAADAIDSDSNAGSMVVLECREANQIFVKAQVGVWTDGGEN